MKLFNTLTRTKEEFVPVKEGHVKMYACGPTVYNYFHLGNARPFVTFDTLRRYLEYRGYEVEFCQNFTDIDDKMIKRANEEGVTVKDVADRYIKEYYVDADGLNCKRPTYQPRATESIGAIIGIIKSLYDKGIAYVIEGDGVYYDVTKKSDYGKLSHYNLEDLNPGGGERKASYDGKILSIPFGGLSGCDIFYNKAIFAEVGIEVPQTIDELEAACDKLLEAGYVPFALANGSKWTGSMYFMYLVARHSGNDEFNAAYDGTGSFTSPAFIWAGEKIQEWVNKGYFNEGFNSMVTDNNEDRALLYNNTCAMMLHGSWQVSGVKSDNADWYNEYFGTFRFPEDAEAKAAGVPQNVEIGTAIGNGFSFNCWKDDGSVDEEKLKACYVLATQYYNDDTYNAQQMENGTTPSIKGFDQTDDPNLKIVIDTFFNASNVQLWYDQYLPASVTEVHKNCMTELFGLTKTPEEIGQMHDEAMAAAREE